MDYNLKCKLCFPPLNDNYHEFVELFIPEKYEYFRNCKHVVGRKRKPVQNQKNVLLKTKKQKNSEKESEINEECIENLPATNIFPFMYWMTHEPEQFKNNLDILDFHLLKSIYKDYDAIKTKIHSLQEMILYFENKI